MTSVNELATRRAKHSQTERSTTQKRYLSLTIITTIITQPNARALETIYRKKTQAKNPQTNSYTVRRHEYLQEA